VTAGLAGLAVVVTASLGAIGFGPITPSSFTPIEMVVLMAVLYGIAEAAVVHVSVRKETHSFSLSEVPLVFGAFAAPPVVVVLGQMIGSGVVLLLVRRQRPDKLAFNLAKIEPSKGSMRGKLKRAGWDNGFLAQILTQFAKVQMR